MLLELIGDALTEHAYALELAGLAYRLSPTLSGVRLVVSGYNDKLHVLARDVFERVRNVQLRADRLEVMKDQVRRSLLTCIHGPG